MNAFDVCPRCEGLGIKVPSATVCYHTSKEMMMGSGEWYGCCGSTCEVGYFSRDSVILLNDINTKIWFKDQGIDVPICYCSNITRREIYGAVDKGCTDIRAVRNYLDKNTTGDCKLKNPIGECCHKVFLREICRRMDKNIGQ